MEINIQDPKETVLIPPEAISLDHRHTFCESLSKVGNICIRCAAFVAFPIANVIALDCSANFLLNNIAPTPLGAALIGISSAAVGAVSTTASVLCATYIDSKLNPEMLKPVSFSSLIGSPLNKVLIMSGAGIGALMTLIAYRHKYD